MKKEINRFTAPEEEPVSSIMSKRDGVRLDEAIDELYLKMRSYIESSSELSVWEKETELAKLEAIFAGDFFTLQDLDEED